MSVPSASRRGSTDNYEQLGAIYKRILMLEMAVDLRLLECRMILEGRSHVSSSATLNSSAHPPRVGSTSRGNGRSAPGVDAVSLKRTGEQ